MPNDLRTSVDWLNSVARDLIRTRMAAYLRLPDLMLENKLQPTPVSFDHFMTLILISHKDIKLIFKLHFNPEFLENWAAEKYDIPKEKVERRQIVDLSKEMCNIAAGTIKLELLLQGVECGTSLPLLSRGFDELFFEQPDNQRIFSSQWGLHAANGQVQCALHIELQNPHFFDQIKVGQVLSSNVVTGEAETL